MMKRCDFCKKYNPLNNRCEASHGVGSYNQYSGESEKDAYCSQAIEAFLKLKQNEVNVIRARNTTTRNVNNRNNSTRNINVNKKKISDYKKDISANLYSFFFFLFHIFGKIKIDYSL